MGELGELLRQSRESQNLTIDQVEEATRIRHVFIQALEEERFADLPGNVYVKGFLRNYAQFLGLNQDEVLAQYHKLSGVATRQVPKVLNEPLLHSARPSLGSTLFLIIMVALVLLIAGWYGYQRFYLGNDPWPSDGLSSLWGGRVAPSVAPTATVALTSEPTASLSATPSQPTAQPSPTAENTTSSAAEAEPTRAPRTAIPSPTPRPRVTRTATPTIAPTRDDAAPIEGIRIEVRVLADTYVAGALDNVNLGPMILKPGDNPVWTAQERVSLRIGNGAGIELTINGVAVGKLGTAGQVVDVEYTLDTLPQE